MHETSLSCCFTQESPALSDPSEHRLIPTLFIYYKSTAYPGAKLIPIPSLRLLFTKLSGFHEYRGSPRSLPYMKELIHNRIGKIDSSGMTETSIVSQVDVSKFKQIILLWPDANGMGWFDIERQIFKRKHANTLIYVLNGRRRLFELPRKQWRAFRLKRFLEKTFLLEIGVLLLFIVTAPILALWDGITDGVRRNQ
ncbi:MAG: hypothetical protein M3Z35_09615 [Nitrospirota bacterium]|nr:hypothetical protein [Nitrospirota bacterium]